MAIGQNSEGQCDIPALQGGQFYGLTRHVFQAQVLNGCASLASLNGEHVCDIKCDPTLLLSALHSQLHRNFAGSYGPFDVVFLNGELLSKLMLKSPTMTMSRYLQDGDMHRCAKQPRLA